MTTLTTAEVAADLNTDPRTLRKFLRSAAAEKVTPVGKGKRYTFTKGDMRSLRSQFATWSAAKAPAAEVEVEVNDDADAPTDD